MKIVILGATGGVGSKLLQQAKDLGHDVTAVVRRPEALPTGIRSVVADMTDVDPAVLEPAFEGADAVLCALGPRSAKDAGILERGVRATLAAMRAAGTTRFVGISAAPVANNDPGDTLPMRAVSPIVKFAFRHQYADLRAAEELLRNSAIGWTMLRPPKLSDKSFTGKYRTAVGQNVRRGWRLGRADLAHELLVVIDRPETFRRTVGVAY